MVVAVVKEENKREEIRFQDFPNSSLSLPLSLSLSLLSFFLPYLVIGGQTREIKGGKKRDPQCNKEQEHISFRKKKFLRHLFNKLLLHLQR